MASNSRKSTVKETKHSSSKKISNESALGTSKSPPLLRRGSLDSQGLQGVQSDLPERDLRLGRATWNKYVLPVQDFNLILFKELFQTYPEYETFFMHMIESPNRDIFSSPNFKNHMINRVVTKLKDIMDSLDKPEELNDTMTKLGLYHVKLGVQRKHLESMQRAIINAIRVCMNKQMQLDEEEALNKCFAFAFRIAINAGEEWLENQRQITAAQQAQLVQKSSRTLRLSVSKKNLIK